jgi:hypothetical protein
MALSLGIGPDHDPPMFDQPHRSARARVRSDVPAPRSRVAEHLLLGLQRTAGNAAVAGLFAHPVVQRFWPFDDDEDEGEEEGPAAEEEEEEDEKEAPSQDEEPEEAPGDDEGVNPPGAGGNAGASALAGPGDVRSHVFAYDPSSPEDEACARNPATILKVGEHGRSYPYEAIPPDIDQGGTGQLALTIAPFTGESIVLADGLDLVGRQALRYMSGIRSPDIERIYYTMPYGHPAPRPGGGAGGPGGPGGAGSGSAGPGGIPGMEPVSPGGGSTGPGGIPGMEPVSPGGGSAGPAATRPMLRKGSNGNAVLELQQLLVRHGAAIDPDGDFGSRTQRAVIDFQRSETLGADGIVGPLTWKALEAG